MRKRRLFSDINQARERTNQKIFQLKKTQVYHEMFLVTERTRKYESKEPCLKFRIGFRLIPEKFIPTCP